MTSTLFNRDQDAANPMASGDLIPSDRDKPEQASLEVEFALVISRMLDSLNTNPEDMRHAIYELARYKLQDQLPDVTPEEKERTQRALEVAIRGVEAFKEQDVLAPPPRLQLSSPRTASRMDDAFYAESSAHVTSSLYLNADAGRTTGGSERTNPLWPRLRRTAAMIAVLVGALVAFQQRERLLSFAHLTPKPEQKSIIDDRMSPLQASNQPVAAPLPPKPNPLRPTDYGVYAVSDNALIGLTQLPGRPPDIRVAVSAAILEPSHTVLANGHPKFIVFRHDLAAGIGERAEVRVIAKIAREFSANAVNKKPSDDAWVMRNISIPFRLSPVSDSPEMFELHSEDPALELTPGRYALVLKTQSYDFSVKGQPTDPKQCIERIVSTSGTFYSECKAP